MRDPQNILVTGGSGFIGSAFIRFLFRQPDFRGTVTNLDALTYAANPDNVAGAVDTARYAFVHGDIGDAALLERLADERRLDTIVHFAAESHVDRSTHGPDVFIQTNVVGTHRLLELVRSRPHIHLHHVSTDEVFGSLGPSGRFREDSPYRPSSPYAASKAASDHLVRAYAQTFGISMTLSNCSNNYGPCQFPEKLVPLMLLHLLGEQPLPVYGDGQHVRDWLFVDDHVEALWTILRRGARGESYVIGGGSERTNLELIHLLIDVVAELTSLPAPQLRQLVTFVADRPGHDRRYAIDCEKLRQGLGWQPRHDLARGMRETVAWYLAHPDWVARVQSGAYRSWLEQNYAGR